jgi:hypothetical protein
MASGRCDGCGKTGPASRISAHILECEHWQRKYATDPGSVRDPETAYAAWQAGGRTEDREDRKAVLAERETVTRTAASARFATPKDILED